ncbi:hypothetical protein ACFXB5_50270, partial [Streptomyces sp. NPDC059455]
MSRLSSPTAVRHNRRAHFVHVESTTVRDASISFRALGLLTYLLDQKEGWQVRSDQLSKGEGREGRGAVRTALRELAAKGYYRLERRRFRTGKCAMGTAISEYPVEQWIKDHEIFSTTSDPAVPVVEQEDGTFLVEYPDGTLVSDGFEPAPYDDEEPPAEPEPEPEKEPAAEELPTAPKKPAPRARRPRKTSEERAAEVAEKEAREKALDEAARKVTTWWWEHAEKHLGKYVGQRGGFMAVMKMVRRALEAGYSQQECAKALQHARKHFPGAQQWQDALGVVTNHIAPKRPDGRIPYSDAATWGTTVDTTQGDADHVYTDNDADDATFGVVNRMQGVCVDDGVIPQGVCRGNSPPPGVPRMSAGRGLGR